jgi:hypothetical protein
VAEICRKLQVTEATFCRWEKKFGGLGVPELRELHQLREKNRRLKGLVADLSVDKGDPPGGSARITVSPVLRREHGVEGEI